MRLLQLRVYDADGMQRGSEGEVRGEEGGCDGHQALGLLPLGPGLALVTAVLRLCSGHGSAARVATSRSEWTVCIARRSER